MRPVTKVILVLAVMSLAVGVIWVATSHWSGNKASETALTSNAPPAAPATSTEGPRAPGYSDPLATYQRYRNLLTGRGSTEPPAVDPHRSGRDVTSTSETEGTVAVGGADEPVAGADPPGPTLHPRPITGDVVTSAWAPHESADGNLYTIASGDTLAALSVKFYGDARYAAAIQAANRGLNPKALHIGERIVIPAKADVIKPPAARPAAAPAAPGAPATAPMMLEPPAPSAPATKVYVVQRNDTLIGIARRFYGDAAMYKKIYEANKDIMSSPNAALQVGQQLRLPQS
jgi:nucleoid-associated protein YgaU